MKVALMLPAGTVTLGGVITWPSILPLRKTAAPPAGAGEVSRTVPVTMSPASTDDELRINEETLGGGVGLPGGVSNTETWKACTPLSLSVPGSIVTRVAVVTGLVAILKSASVPPAGMKTVAGGLTRLVSPLTRRTVTPPGGAADCSVTVPVNEVPPTTLSWLSSMP